MISQLIKGFKSVASREIDFTAQTFNSCWLLGMMDREVTIDLSKRGHKVAVTTVKQGIILYSVCLKVVFKVGSLRHNLEADRTLVTGVILEGFSSHPDLVRNVDDSMGASRWLGVWVGSLGHAVIKPNGRVIIVNTLYGGAVIHSDNVLAV